MSLLGRLQPLIAKRRASPPAPTVPVTADRYELVIVSYHSKDHVAALLEAASPDQRIVVVDNASGADGVAEVVRRFEHGRYLDGRDSGFAVAANLGAFSSSADYVVFANPDSRPTSWIWQALVAELGAGSNEGRVHVLAADLAVPGEPERLWAEALAWRGRIDVLVNNAGVYLASPLDDPAAWDAGWSANLTINLLAPATLCRLAVGEWRGSGGGIIVNVTSRAAHRGDDAADRRLLVPGRHDHRDRPVPLDPEQVRDRPVGRPVCRHAPVDVRLTHRCAHDPNVGRRFSRKAVEPSCASSVV